MARVAEGLDAEVDAIDRHHPLARDLWPVRPPSLGCMGARLRFTGVRCDLEWLGGEERNQQFGDVPRCLLLQEVTASRKCGDLGVRHVAGEPLHRLGDVGQDPVLLSVHDPDGDAQPGEAGGDLGEAADREPDPGLGQHQS